ncbi:S9 family peptidase [Phenylobacterium sp.]|uniref:alpha/beta hydrolase family protein n=1 Tax=Phenylobacterium sp. TaxID=1871053 RepID=UPI002638ED8E|nr:S9 family peptidase [Phenylobacterium sp.]
MAVALAALAAAAAISGVHQYERVALSPNGAFVASVESFETPRRPEAPHGTVVVRRASDGVVMATYDPCATCRYDDPAWSPDGKTLAFTSSDRKTHTSALVFGDTSGAHTVLSFDGLIAKPRFSPDGKALAVLATAHAHKEAGATSAGTRRVGDLDAAPDERRIAVVEGQALRMVSPGDRFVYEYDWTPDGKGFVASDAPGDGDNNYWVARLEAVDLATGQARLLAAPKLQVANPRAAPDGKSVLFIGGLMSDFGSVGGDLYAVPIAGGEPQDLTPGFNGSFTSLMRTRTGVFATVLVGDRQSLVEIGKAGPGKPLWTDAASIGAGDGHFSMSADGRELATSYQTFALAPRIVAGPLGKAVPITHDNDALTANAEAKSVTWTNEGHQIQGWLLTPKGLTAGKTYPMAVQVHGGPSAAVTPRFIWEGDVHALLGHGYFIFLPNPRGSYGQGEAFTKANIEDFGGGDLRDILKGVDAVEKIAPVDDHRLAVMGGSYGGFMTMWTVTQTNRFRAGAAGAGIADWVSYYGENGIDQWMVPFFGGTAYDNPAVYDRLSPIRYIRQAKTPTFIYVGELDVECPAPQSIEMWHGLKAMGVPTSLMIYPGEGHHIADPVHQADIEDRVVAWFDKYLGS